MALGTGKCWRNESFEGFETRTGEQVAVGTARVGQGDPGVVAGWGAIFGAHAHLAKRFE
jgi:hypothetical protein